MEQNRFTKIIAVLMLIAGALLLVQTCTSSDPVDLKNPSNNVSPQRLGNAVRSFENIQAAAIPEFTGKAIPTANLDLDALKKMQKKYEASLKKKEDAKKKKVAKKTKKKQPIAARKTNGRYLSNERETPVSPSQPLLGGGGAAPAATPETPDTTNPQPTNGYEYWRNLVFSNPSNETSEQLLAAYLQGKIPAEWFYRINDEMISSTNGILQESAINLLAMTPSTESFNRMSLIVDERNVQPNLKLLARASMNDVYKNFAYLGTLATALQNSDTIIAYHGARMILLSAQTNLNASTSDAFMKAITSAGNNTSAYTQLLPALDQIRQNTTNDRLKQFTNDAYVFISQYMNNSKRLTAGLGY